MGGLISNIGLFKTGFYAISATQSWNQYANFKLRTDWFYYLNLLNLLCKGLTEWFVFLMWVLCPPWSLDWSPGARCSKLVNSHQVRPATNKKLSLIGIFEIFVSINFIAIFVIK